MIERLMVLFNLNRFPSQKISTFTQFMKLLAKQKRKRYNKKFVDDMWKTATFNNDTIKPGYLLRLKNKRFTGNVYKVTKVYGKGFDCINYKLKYFKFENLDYDSIDRVLSFDS